MVWNYTAELSSSHYSYATSLNALHYLNGLLAIPPD